MESPGERRLATEPVGSEPPVTVETCLERVATGDMGAFETIYRELGGPVLGLIRRVLRDSAQSEEVAQEVFMEVWQSAARFDARFGGGRAWVLTIAHRRAVDRVRSVDASARRDAEAARQRQEATPPDDLLDQVASHLERDRVRRCLGRLTDLQRESVRLTYYAGHTYREAAELLGVPLTTIKARLRDGLGRLRDCLEVTR